jgi:DNA-binding transcriptional MerR regulator
MRTWKVGELARRTGLTVRALHHYDEIGLLSPSHRTGAGHRLYSVDDLARLQQILSLRQLGFSLEEIRNCLGRPEFSPQRVLELHLSRLREQIDTQQRLCRRLEGLARGLNSAEGVSAEEFFQTMEMMIMYEKYFTPEQQDAIEARGRALGPEKIQAVEAEWPELIARVRAEMDRGTDPASEPVQQLARRWMELVAEFTGGDPGIQKSLNTMYRQEPAVQNKAGIDPAMFDYIGKAIAAIKGPSPQA